MDLTDLFADLDRALGRLDAHLARRYPGDPGHRQPVHTVYVPADRYHADLCRQWADEAARTLAEHAPTPSDLARATGLSTESASQVYRLVTTKLGREPIEDLRIDFEDGYGARPDDEEDAAVRAAAKALAESVAAGGAPPFIGIRFKSFEAVTRRRGLRTLDGFLAVLLEAAPLPDGFVVTLPKVTAVEQVAAMATVCARLEQGYSLPSGLLRFEVQVETPQAILSADGAAAVARMIDAAQGRCAGLHYGTYDYSAALGVAAAYQSMEHPVADHAKAVMQLAAAGTGVRVSDGSTNVLPVGDRAAVHAAWRLHTRLVRRSLERGFYQGWDLHPAQLPTRYAATYAFFREGLSAAAARLRAYLERADSGVLDEPATVQALAGFMVRGVDCGAVDPAEAADLTGLDYATLACMTHTRRNAGGP